MKNNRFARLLALLLSCLFIFGAMVEVIAAADVVSDEQTGADTGDDGAQSSPSITVKYKNLSYAAANQLVFYVKSENLEADQRVKLLFFTEERSNYDVSAAFYVSESSGQITVEEAAGPTSYDAYLSHEIAPVDMRKPIYIVPTIFNANGGVVSYGEPFKYSIYDYVLAGFVKGGSDDQIALYTALLDYGAAVQTVLNESGVYSDEELEAVGYADQYYGIMLERRTEEKLLAEEYIWLRAGEKMPFEEKFGNWLFNRLEYEGEEVEFDNNKLSGNKPGLVKATAIYKGYINYSQTVFDFEDERTIEQYVADKSMWLSVTNTVYAEKVTENGNTYYQSGRPSTSTDQGLTFFNFASTMQGSSYVFEASIKFTGLSTTTANQWFMRFMPADAPINKFDTTDYMGMIAFSLKNGQVFCGDNSVVSLTEGSDGKFSCDWFNIKMVVEPASQGAGYVCKAYADARGEYTLFYEGACADTNVAGFGSMRIQTRNRYFSGDINYALDNMKVYAVSKRAPYVRGEGENSANAETFTGFVSDTITTTTVDGDTVLVVDKPTGTADAGGTVEVSMTEAYVGTDKLAVWETDILLNSFDTTGSGQVFWIYLYGKTGKTLQFALLKHTNGGMDFFGTNIAVGSWHNLRVEIDLEKNLLDAFFDGEEIASNIDATTKAGNIHVGAELGGLSKVLVMGRRQYGKPFNLYLDNMFLGVKEKTAEEEPELPEEPEVPDTPEYVEPTVNEGNLGKGKYKDSDGVVDFESALADGKLVLGSAFPTLSTSRPASGGYNGVYTTGENSYLEMGTVNLGSNPVANILTSNTTGEVFVAEFDFAHMGSDSTDWGLKFAFNKKAGDGNQTCPDIPVKYDAASNRFYFAGNDGKKFASNTWHTVRLEYNHATDTLTVYVNSELVYSTVWTDSKKDNDSTFNYLMINIRAKGQTNTVLRFDNIYVSTKDAESFDEGKYKDQSNNANTVVGEPAQFETARGDGNRYVFETDIMWQGEKLGETDNIFANLSLMNKDGDVFLPVYLVDEGASNRLSLVVGSQGDAVKSFENGLWYNVRIEYVVAEGTTYGGVYSVLVNGNPVVEEVEFFDLDTVPNNYFDKATFALGTELSEDAAVTLHNTFAGAVNDEHIGEGDVKITGKYEMGPEIEIGVGESEMPAIQDENDDVYVFESDIKWVGTAAGLAAGADEWFYKMALVGDSGEELVTIWGKLYGEYGYLALSVDKNEVFAIIPTDCWVNLLVRYIANDSGNDEYYISVNGELLIEETVADRTVNSLAKAVIAIAESVSDAKLLLNYTFLGEMNVDNIGAGDNVDYGNDYDGSVEDFDIVADGSIVYEEKPTDADAWLATVSGLPVKTPGWITVEEDVENAVLEIGKLVGEAKATFAPASNSGSKYVFETDFSWLGSTDGIVKQSVLSEWFFKFDVETDAGALITVYGICEKGNYDKVILSTGTSVEDGFATITKDMWYNLQITYGTDGSYEICLNGRTVADGTSSAVAEGAVLTGASVTLHGDVVYDATVHLDNTYCSAGD